MRLSRMALLMTILALCAAFQLAGCREDEKSRVPDSERTLVMGFVPSVQVENLMAAAEPLLEMLTEETGLKFESMRSTSYIMLVEAMGTGSVDVGWLPPLAYVYAHERYDAEVAFMVVRRGKPSYRGQIIAGAGTDIQTIEDLKGKKFAFVNPTSTSGYLYPMTMLKKAGLDIDNDLIKQQVGAHDAVVRNVASGDFEAGATYEGAEDKLVAEDPQIKDKIRIVAFTDDIPADTVTFVSGLDPEVKQKIKDALLKISQTEAGAKALMDIYEAESLAPATDEDFSPVREMVTQLDVDILERLKKFK